MKPSPKLFGLALVAGLVIVGLPGLVSAPPDSEWSIQTVDSEGNVGYYTSIALDSSDRPHISYYDETNDDLKYARWTPNNEVGTPAPDNELPIWVIAVVVVACVAVGTIIFIKRRRGGEEFEAWEPPAGEPSAPPPSEPPPQQPPAEPPPVEPRPQ